MKGGGVCIKFILKHLVCRASEAVFYEKLVVQGFLAENHHNQSTIVGKSESYNETFRNSPATEFCRNFVVKNRKISATFDEDVDIDEEEEKDEENSCKEFRKTFYWECNRRSLSSVIWLQLALEEMLDRKMMDTEYFGPRIDKSGARVTNEESLNLFREKINRLR